MNAIAVYAALTLAIPTVDGARATLDGGKLTVDVAMSEPVLREEVRSKLEDKRLSLYIEGAELAGRRNFGNGQLALTALPRASYAKLELPLRPEMGCAGPVSLRVTDTGVRASLTCKPASPPAAQPAPAKAPDKAAPEAKPATAETTAAAAPVPAPGPSPVPAPSPATGHRPPVPVPAPAAAAPAKPTAARPAPIAAIAKTSSLPMMAMLAMVGLAVFLLWRKRKQQKTGLIQILETASLGPKRALIIAEVNGERMILGTSEAGIHLLQPVRPAGYPTGAFPAAFSEQTLGGTPIPAAPMFPPSPPSADPGDGEGGMLSKLFKLRQAKREEQAAAAAADDEGPSTMAQDFADLLNDSVEDEKLRRRLQAGVGGRTQ